jgi:hypothetical protein
VQYYRKKQEVRNNSIAKTKNNKKFVCLEVVDGLPQAEPVWALPSLMFIYLRAAPVQASAPSLFASVKRKWPIVKERFEFGRVIEQVESLAERAREDISVVGTQQHLAKLVIARIISRDHMMIAFTRLKSALALAIIERHK